MKQKISFQSSAFVIKLPSRRDNVNKIRVVVSAKVSKKAVQRNKIRRLIKEAWRLLKITNTLPPHIYVKKSALGMSLLEIKNELSRVFKKNL